MRKRVIDIFGFVLLLVLAGCAAAPKPEPAAPTADVQATAAVPMEQTAEGAAAVINPANLIPHNGKRIFLSGMNLAWMDFAKDLDNFNEAKFTSQVDNISSAGGNCIRWWIFVNGSASPVFGPDGLVRELPMEQILVLKRALDIAFERGVGLILCLWSFDMLQNQVGVDQQRNKRLLEDPVSTKAFIDNALIPMVRKLKNHPGLIAWEVFNEPEGMLEPGGWTPRKTAMENVQAFINRVAGAIHREAPNNLVTNGSSQIQMSTDVNGLINYYTDERLIKAGGDLKGTLDFYCVHYYPEYYDEAFSPFYNPKDHWNLDKPLVIGEFPAKGIAPSAQHPGFKPKTRLTTDEAYQYAIENGYAGALSWTMTNHDGYGGFFHASDAMGNISMLYGDFINLDRSGLDRAPQAAKPVKDLILNVGQKDWPNVLDFTQYIQDAEDGTSLGYAVDNPGDPSVAVLSLTPKGMLSIKLPGEGKLGDVRVTIMVKDSSENELPVSFIIHVLDPDRGNIALLKPATASSIEDAEKAIPFLNDGNVKTRWSSEYKDGQWCMVDLQGTFHVTNAILNWEAAFGKDYSILGSMDGTSWTVLAEVTGGDGGTDEVALSAANVRYVKVDCKFRGTQWGFSLWELQVIGERVR
jgi:hypothetical protein